MTKFFGQDHRGRDDGARQRATAYFINSSNASDAGGAKFFFVTKSAAPVHPRKSLADLREVTSDE
jgi:hypothetical protein